MSDDIQYLKDRASDLMQGKALDRLRAKLSERAQEIKDAPDSQHMDFYCTTCERDFGAIGFKQVRVPRGSVWFAYYEAQCPNGHTCLRYITDKITDPYFTQSPFIRAQQNQFEDAMLSPDSPRFKLLYPEAHERLKGGDFRRELAKPLHE